MIRCMSLTSQLRRCVFFSSLLALVTPFFLLLFYLSPKSTQVIHTFYFHLRNACTRSKEKQNTENKFKKIIFKELQCSFFLLQISSFLFPVFTLTSARLLL